MGMVFTTESSLFFIVLLLHISNTEVVAAAVKSTHSPSTKENVSKQTGKGTTTSAGAGTKIEPIFDSDKCTITYGSGKNEQIVNLSLLPRRDGLPRYNTTFNDVPVTLSVSRPFNYSYNPCVTYSLPRDNPHGNFGDGCHNAIVCKYTGSQENSNYYYYTLGIKSPEKVSVSGWRYPDNSTRVSLIYTGIKSLRLAKTVVTLVCDPSLSSADQGLFKIVTDDGRYRVHSELHHQCCCPDACVDDISDEKEGGKNDEASDKIEGKTGAATDKIEGKTGAATEEGKDSGPESDEDGEMMLVIIGSAVGVVLSALLVGGLCYVKRTHVYSKLPGVRSSGGTGSVHGGGGDGKTATDFRDYEPAAMAGVRHKLLPVLEDSCIHSTRVEMGKRLGGGIFGDTHLGRFNGMTVTVKRLTLSIHLDQLTEEMMEWMKEEIAWISRQRHKNMVSVMGLSLDGRLPFLMTEYVLGDCLKDFLKSNGHMLTWPQRVRMCQQVAEGVSFLHNTKPPIIHRDLRCGNLFISDNDLVKVADFSLTKLLQPMREQCDTDDCSCNRLMSACPGRIRWTAPELLQNPRAKEGESSTISSACDVYSFGMVMWEMVMVRDPFQQMKTEAEVMEVVKNGGRPDTPANVNMLIPYKSLMKTCWDQKPGLRPQCKQVAVRLKDMIGAARSHQRQVSNGPSVAPIPKPQESVMAV